MQIDKLPDKALSRLKEKGYVEGNRCFANCSMIVYQLPLAGFSYVLCWLTDDHGIAHPHAIVERDGLYFDPTLQHESHRCKAYKHVRSYTRDELVQAIVEGGGRYDQSDGAIEGYPPALLGDGSVRCIEVSKL